MTASTQGTLPEPKPGDIALMTQTAPRLLVVDDEPAVLSVVERFAHKLGFEVIFRSSGKEALKCLAEVKPDVALVDLQMPELSGIEVLRAVRAAEPGCQVILMTGHATVDTAIEAAAASSQVNVTAARVTAPSAS